MSYVWFTPETKAWAMQVPKHWELELHEGTYTWSDPDDWKGNFRLTPMIWGGEPGEADTKGFLDEEFSDHPGAERKTYGEFDAVYYIKRTTDEEDRISVFYWSLAKAHYVFLFSFTVYEADERSEETKEELERIDTILHSFKLNTGSRG